MDKHTLCGDCGTPTLLPRERPEWHLGAGIMCVWECQVCAWTIAVPDAAPLPANRSPFVVCDGS